MPTDACAVYYDSEYGGAWVEEKAAVQVKDFLGDRGFDIVDAEQLAALLAKKLQDGAGSSVVVFAHDSFPDTVFNHASANTLVRHYLDAGGKVVWLGDIPFWRRAGKAKAADETWPYLPFAQILQVVPVIAVASQKVELTKKGRQLGLRTLWFGERPCAPVVVGNWWTRNIARRFNSGEAVRLGGELFLHPLAESRPVFGRPVTEQAPRLRWSASLGVQPTLTVSNEPTAFQAGITHWNKRWINAFRISFSRRNPGQGFVRLWDYQIGELSADQLSELLAVATGAPVS